jgi:hypothetical protein
MRIRTVVPAVFVLSTAAALWCASITPAQAPAPAARAAAPAAARPAGGAQVEGNLLQVMRGILFPNSNVIFYAQSNDPTKVKKDADATLAVNPYAGTYGGWEAVENSGIAIAEAANLLTIPGRICSNGKPAPIQNADWQKFVQDLRAAGMATYKAAKTKNMDKIVDVSDTVTTACANCHNVYREKSAAQGGLSARCTK